MGRIQHACMFDQFRQLLNRPHIVTDGNDLVLTHDIVSVLVYAAIPCVALVIGIGCWRFAAWLARRETPDPQAALKVRIVACCAFVFALAMFAMLIPGLINLEVRITDDRLTQSIGIWTSENVREFPFDHIESIREDTQHGEFGPELVWIIHWRGGRTERFDPCDLIEGNSEYIGNELRKRGVDFHSLSR